VLLDDAHHPGLHGSCDARHDACLLGCSHGTAAEAEQAAATAQKNRHARYKKLLLPGAQEATSVPDTACKQLRHRRFAQAGNIGSMICIEACRSLQTQACYSHAYSAADVCENAQPYLCCCWSATPASLHTSRCAGQLRLPCS
jgi:hypothetical protein